MPSSILIRHHVAIVMVGVITVPASLGAYLIRFDVLTETVPWDVWLRTLPVIMAVRIVIAGLYGLHRILLLRVTVSDVLKTLTASTVGSFVILACVVTARAFDFDYLGAVPLGVVILDWGLTIGGLQAVWLVSASSRAFESPAATKRVVIVGAGESGISLALQMQRSPHHRLSPVAFVDDDGRKQRGTISGIPVEGPIERIPQVVRDYQADLLLIAVPTATQEQTRRLVEYCQRADTPYRILPSIAELVDGHVDLARVRDLDVADLLARPMAEIDYAAVRRLISGSRVVVTGGGGSVGFELARQVARLAPEALVLIDHAENPLFDADRALHREFPGLDVRPLVVDVTDRASLARVMRQARPRLVIHAAAHKHVPLMEQVPGEAVRNNVGGTLHAAEVAREVGAECFVLVSTDKAVEPSSVMGATKRLCELVVQEIARGGDTRFVAVRFGNVLGSNGSVVPTFLEQIRRNGPVTVTDERMERYFMALPEAAGLILEAAAIGESEQTFILDMGEPIRIVNLAETMIRMHGLQPYQDIDIVFTGIRPGEKLTEELNYSTETFVTTGHHKLLAVPRGQAVTVIPQVMQFLRDLPAIDDAEVRGRLWALIGLAESSESVPAPVDGHRDPVEPIALHRRVAGEQRT